MALGFPKDLQEVKAFAAMLGEARLARYLALSGGEEAAAINLYIWNNRISQAFFLPLHLWEICLRNQMNRFLCWKFNPSWPHDDKRAVRQLQGNDRDKLLEARDRQARQRNVQQATTDSIVADLSAGFWVALLAQRYVIPMAWRYNLPKVFPNAPEDWKLKPTGWSPTQAHLLCDDVLALRNRVAHHEAIIDMDLQSLNTKIRILVAAMCSASQAYLTDNCVVQATLEERPP